MKKILIASILFGLITGFYPRQKLNWIPIEQLEEKLAQEKRKVFFDIYTDWCGVCKRMDRNTFQNKTIVKHLNENYYAVKINAEQKEDILFNGTNFKYVEKGRSGVHEFALYITNNNLLGYPSIAFMDENKERLTSITAYLTPVDIEPILHFFSENKYKLDLNSDKKIDQSDYNLYVNEFKSSF